MKEKILAYLKLKLAGVQEAYLAALAENYAKTITDEAQIAIVITDGAIEIMKASASHLQVEGDRRAAEASKTSVKTFREKHNLDSNGKPIESKATGDPEPDPDEPKWAKALREKLEAQTAELKTKFEGLEKAKTQEQLMAKFQAKLKEKGVDELYIPIYSRNLVIESEDKLDQLVEDTDKAHKDFVQKSADKGVIISIPGQSAGPAEAGEATGKALAEKRNTSATSGVPGKKV